MSQWDSLILSSPASSKASVHPLHGSGLPAYQKSANLPGVYTYPEFFENGGKKVPSLSLFDNRNSWIRDGLSSRLFPVWSSEKFYHAFKESLYRTLHRFFRANRDGNPMSRREHPEDYWTDVQLYFLEKTEKEQLGYAELVGRFGSFCHYPLGDSYQNGAEILLGILSVYHDKIRDIFRQGKTEESLSLDQISESPDEMPGGVNEDLHLVELAEGLSSELSTLKELKNPSDLEGFFHYLSLDGTFEKKCQSMKAWPELSPGVLRKIEHLLNARILPPLLGSDDLAANKKDRARLLRRVAQTWLARKTS
ncbi:MAG: hypothetical protein JNM63_04970 [Spirochaetia bacterium]|nr:hypothetical protein [Spirochaetia bacterium]